MPAIESSTSGFQVADITKQPGVSAIEQADIKWVAIEGSALRCCDPISDIESKGPSQVVTQLLHTLSCKSSSKTLCQGSALMVTSSFCRAILAGPSAHVDLIEQMGGASSLQSENFSLWLKAVPVQSPDDRTGEGLEGP